MKSDEEEKEKSLDSFKVNEKNSINLSSSFNNAVQHSNSFCHVRHRKNSNLDVSIEDQLT